MPLLNAGWISIHPAKCKQTQLNIGIILNVCARTKTTTNEKILMSESIKNQYSTTASCNQNKMYNNSTNLGFNRQNLSFPILGRSVEAVCLSAVLFLCCVVLRLAFVRYAIHDLICFRSSLALR